MSSQRKKLKAKINLKKKHIHTISGTIQESVKRDRSSLEYLENKKPRSDEEYTENGTDHLSDESMEATPTTESRTSVYKEAEAGRKTTPTAK